MIETIITGFALGLGGSLHCVGMCGTIVTAFSFATKNKNFLQSTLTTLHYNLGRVLTYCLLGALAGFISTIGESLGFLIVLRALAATLLIATGIYLLGWWNGILLLEKVGAQAWRKIQPLTKKLNPSRSRFQATLSGMLWGLLPCGLVYSAIAIATAQGGVPKGILFMLAFGFGTLGPLMMMGIGFTRVSQWLRRKLVKITLGGFMIAMGCWSLYSINSHGNSHDHHEQDPDKQTMHQHH